MKSSSLRVVVCGVLGLVWACALGVRQAAAEEVTLSGERWTIRIEPRTLGVVGRLQGAQGAELPISWPRAAEVRVDGLAAGRDEVRWSVPEEHVMIRMRLEGDALLVDVKADAAGAFTWPIVGGGFEAAILPMAEGVYVPGGDAQWVDFLVRRGGMDTTAELSMPFWGIVHGGSPRTTVTYILTNPFNNELTPERNGERLGMRFTHTFTRNNPVKEYGLRIELGDGSPVAPAKAYRRYLEERGELVTLREKIAKTPEVAKLLGAAHVYLWGDGQSVAMVEKLSAAGLGRLWLGSPNWDGLGPDMVKRALAAGYLVGPYDSYDSVHAPGEVDTWETAQFDQKLYESGAVVRADGAKRTGFGGKGFALSSVAARPYVEERVERLMKRFGCNSWFMDCDAFGQLWDDYSSDHPTTQAQDAQERLSRMAWIVEKYHVVMGSEGGSAYAAPVIHFAHGMMTPVIGWGDAEMYKDRSSRYFLGGYYPPEGPAKFFRQVPMKEEYRRVYADPRHRLPLYQVVFHDSVVSTHHWTFGSLKFEDPDHERELLELLYCVPPLYHLNMKAWEKEQARIRQHCSFFSPLHREAGLLPMTDFRWLAEDRMVQRATFGDQMEIVANFGGGSFVHEGEEMAPRSVLVRWVQDGRVMRYAGAP